jgi:hypothetical protein
MSEHTTSERANEYAFIDTPVSAAKRRAFDAPTQAHLDALIDAVRAEPSPCLEPSGTTGPADAPPDANELVTCTLRDPDWVCHLKRSDCYHESPHHIDLCGAFDRFEMAGPADAEVVNGFWGFTYRVCRSCRYAMKGEQCERCTGPADAPAIERVREVVAAFSEGYRRGYERGESGEAEDKENAWDRSKASAGLLTTLAGPADALPMHPEHFALLEFVEKLANDGHLEAKWLCKTLEAKLLAGPADAGSHETQELARMVLASRQNVGRDMRELAQRVLASASAPAVPRETTNKEKADMSPGNPASDGDEHPPSTPETK